MLSQSEKLTMRPLTKTLLLIFLTSLSNSLSAQTIIIGKVLMMAPQLIQVENILLKLPKKVSFY